MPRTRRTADAIHAFEPPLPVIRTERCREVAVRFGVAGLLAADAAPRRRPRCPVAPPVAGELLLLSGPSGSGKSSLLRAIRAAATRRGDAVIDLRRTALAERPIIELFADASLGDTLRRLARVGLAEVWTWLRPPSQLSEGQRWRLRLRLALAIAQAEGDATPRPICLICDEFAAVLDRVSAYVVAGVLRRAVDALPGRLSAAVATSHDDLDVALAPDVVVACDFGEVTVRNTDRKMDCRPPETGAGPAVTSRTRPF